MAVGQKAKRRNSEKRKEHSRDAARCRRSREAEVFLHLSKEIPLSYDLVKVLDKTSMIRLTIAYLKLQTLFSDARHESNTLGKAMVGQLERKIDHFCQKALDGFVMVVASGGDVLYVTDNIAGFLGLTQVDVMGQSIFDLTHPCDHDELRDMIGSKSHQPSNDSHRIVFIRMKSTITSRGRNVNIKSASYKVISCTGHLKQKHWNSGVDEGVEEEEGEVPFVVIIGRMISHPSNVEAALDSWTFVSRHSLDMKFTDCDERIRDLIGYTVGDVIGKSMYSYYHALDSETLERAYKTLFCKGQASTGLYRFLAHHGGYIWVDTHATVVNNAVTDKPEHIVCIHYVVSGVEGQDTVFDVVQMSSEASLPVKSGTVEKNKDDLAIEIVAGSCLDDEDDNDQSCVQFATEEILAQVVREKHDSELFSRDLSLYSANRTLMERTNDEKSSDEVGDEDDNEPGMTKNFSNFSLTSFLDKMDESLETRAPYVSMDDLVFSSCNTPLSQSHDQGSHPSSLMNSDPLLSSVEHEGLLLTGPMPPPPLFTVDLTDVKMDLPPQKSFGAKRSCAGTDTCSLPCKAPRLELDQEPPSYLEMRDFASPVSSATGQAAHIPTVTASQTNPPRAIALPIQQSGSEQIKFLQHVTEPYKKDYGERESEVPVTTVYLVWNKKRQLDPDVIAPNPASSEAGQQCNQGVTIYRPALNPSQVQFLEKVKVANQLAVVNENDIAGGGKLFLDVTRPDGKLLGMMSKNDTSVASLVSVNGPTSTIAAKSADCLAPAGMTVLDSGIKHGMPVHSPCTSAGSPIDASKSYIRHLSKPQDPDLNATSDKAIRVIASTGKKTAFVFPTQKMSAVVRQPLSQGVDVVQNLQSRSCFTGSSTGAGVSQPLHLRVRDPVPSAVERVTPKTLLSDAGFLKMAMMSGGVVRNAATGKDSLAGGSVVLKAGGNGEQPLYLLGKSVAPSWQPAGVASSVSKMNTILASRGGLLTTQLQKPRTTVAVGNALQFDGHKMAVTKHSELQRGEGGTQSRPGNQENLGPICIEPLTSSDASGSSVLMNLLMKGVDVNYGYRLENSSSHGVSK